MYKNIKRTIKKKNVRNPENEKDVKLKLKYSTTKNEMLEKELREMENKIKNIQKSYFDMVKDNEKILINSLFLEILSVEAFCVFKIFPRRGKHA